MVDIIGFDHIKVEQVDIPHYKSPCGKVIGAFLSKGAFGIRAVIILASHFNGKYRSAFQKFHACGLACIPRRIGTE